MLWEDKPLKRNQQGDPVPQHWNPEIEDWEVAEVVQKTEVTGSKIESVQAREGQSLPNGIKGETPGFFEPRDDSLQRIEILQSDIGVFDQAIFLSHNLDTDVEIYLRPYVEAERFLAQPDITPIITLKPLEILILASEKGINVQEGSNNNGLIYEIPELRLPYPGFRLYYQPVNEPTEGRLRFRSVRRY